MARDTKKGGKSEKADYPQIKLISCPIRLSYPHFFDPSINKKTGKETWECDALVPPDKAGDKFLDDLDAALVSVMTDHFGHKDEWPRGRNDYEPADKIKRLDPDDLPGGGITADWSKFTARSYSPIGVVDADRNDVLNKRECYGGRWARLSLTITVYDNESKGPAIYLNNAQLLEHDESFGGRPAAADEFSAWEGDGRGSGSRDRDSGRARDREDQGSADDRGRGGGRGSRDDGRGSDRAGSRSDRDEGRSDRDGSRDRGDSRRDDERPSRGGSRDDAGGSDRGRSDRDRESGRDAGDRGDSRDGGRGSRDQDDRRGSREPERARGRDDREERGRGREDAPAGRGSRDSARDDRDAGRDGGRGRGRDEAAEEDRRPSRGRDDDRGDPRDNGDDWN